MSLDEELRRAGRDLVTGSAARQTPEGLRRLHRRRRTVRTVVPVAAAVVLGLVLWPAGADDESGVEVVDTPTTSIDQPPVRIESGLGPTTVLAADGTPLTTLDSEDFVPGQDDLAVAVMNEIAGIGTGTGSSASAVFDTAGLAELPDEALAQLADAGLVIQTTIETEAQGAATDAIDAAGLSSDLSTGLWSIDPNDGATLALAGPVCFIERAAGGAIRPAMMAVALESGVAADEKLDNPPSLTVDVDGFDWQVQNLASGGVGTGPLTLGQALAEHANTPWAGLLADGRINESVYADVAERFRFRDLDPVVPSMVLGVFNTDLVEVARMTAVFATDGSMPEVHLIDKVRTHDDRLLYDRTAMSVEPPPPIVEPATVEAVRTAMADAVCCGTATGAQLTGNVEQFGQTGTYPGPANAWFTGSTPSLTTVVWAGDLGSRTQHVDPQLTDGGAPASIWADYTGATSRDEPRTFPR